MHHRPAALGHHDQGFNRGLPLLEILLGLGELLDIVLEGDELAATGQRNRIIEAARPGHLKASNEPGRVALVCRIISLGPLAAFIATHLGADLIERHGAEHWDPPAEHFERHPDRSLAALATDPGITLGLKLGDSSVVCHPRIKARSERERTSFRPRRIPGCSVKAMKETAQRKEALEFRCAVARRTVKVAATLGLDKIKAFRKDIHVYGPSVRLRKPGYAGLSAIWAPKLFNPTLDNTGTHDLFYPAYLGGCKLGDDSHSLIWEAVSS